MKPPGRPTSACPPEHAFRFHSGATARSLADLADRLVAEPVGVTYGHREHFAAWIRDVLGDGPLAARVDAYASAGMEATAFRDAILGLVLTRTRGAAAASTSP